MRSLALCVKFPGRFIGYMLWLSSISTYLVVLPGSCPLRSLLSQNIAFTSFSGQRDVPQVLG